MRIRSFLLSLLVLLSFTAPADARRPRAKYVIIVSMDGFRHDYPDIYWTPNLDKMEREGVSTDMIPSYPSSTFPNHYAIATGLVPDHNGLVNNTFWDEEIHKMYSISGTAKQDPRFYLGEPVWNTAQRQGVLAGVNYWVSSDFAVNGSHPRYYRKYEGELISYEARVDSTIALMPRTCPSMRLSLFTRSLYSSEDLSLVLPSAFASVFATAFASFLLQQLSLIALFIVLVLLPAPIIYP